MPSVVVLSVFGAVGASALLGSETNYAWRDAEMFAKSGDTAPVASSRAVADRLLSLEQEELNDLPMQAVQDSAREAWWGVSEEGSNSELRRMGDLMRRQLAPALYSYSMFYEETGVPTAMPSPMPSPMPTAFSNDTASSGETHVPTAQPTEHVSTTHAPTTASATSMHFVSSAFYVTGVNAAEFGEDAERVVSYSLNDVVSFLDTPEDVTEVSVAMLRRRLDESTTALIHYTLALDTPASHGFASPMEAVAVMEAEINEAAASGYLAQRILYWSTEFAVTDFTPVIDDSGDSIVVPGAGTVVAGSDAPVASPTAAQTLNPAATHAPSAAPVVAPTTAPVVVTHGPTTAPVVAAQTAAPTAAVVTPPTTSGTAAPAATAAPVAAPTAAPVAAPTAAPTAAVVTPPTTSGTDDVSAPTVVVDDDTPDATARSSKKKKSSNSTAQTNLILIIVFLSFLGVVLLVIFYVYLRNRERKLTERKDSWDISTMFTDEANLPDAEEMIDVEPETEPASDPEDVAGATLIEGGEGGELVPLDEDQPQALQKITQAAEL